MTCTLRKATIADAELIADMSRQTFYDTFAADNDPADMQLFLNEQFTRGRLLIEVGRPGLEFILAYVGSEVAGYLKLRDARPPAGIDGPALEVARLYALKNFIGKGIGAALIEESLRIAAGKGKEWIWLGVWERNARAIAFYERWGFEKFSECDFLLGHDKQRDWLMKRRV
ncbi:MAG: family N-acetyltransferase [Verrucomicrobiales bacterium]|nr:family N-acetyltransferase [Verrucomicrobiales bacterium]